MCNHTQLSQLEPQTRKTTTLKMMVFQTLKSAGLATFGRMKPEALSKSAPASQHVIIASLNLGFEAGVALTMILDDAHDEAGSVPASPLQFSL